MSLFTIARILIIFGVILVLAGGALYFVGRFNLPLGRLPGDLVFRRGNFTIAIPIVTSIMLSILLTIGINVLIRFLNR